MSKSLLKIFQVLEAITSFDGKPRLADLQALLDIPKGSLHRYVNELLEHGLIRKTLGGHRYAPGYKLLSLAKRSIIGSELIQSADRPMKNLHIDTGETIFLSVLDGHEVICIKQIQATHAIRSSIDIGDKFPVYATASGKVMIAFSSHDIRKNLCETIKLVPLTENTVINSHEFLNQLDVIRIQGYAINNQEDEDGFLGVAVPVFDPAHNVIAALSISFPIIRLPNDIVSNIIPILNITSAAITKKIKYYMN